MNYFDIYNYNSKHNTLQHSSTLPYSVDRNTGDILCHYGLLGMKWGQRRWQYPDGRFNEEGKERYFGSNSKSGLRLENTNIKQIYNNSGIKKGIFSDDNSTLELLSLAKQKAFKGEPLDKKSGFRYYSTQLLNEYTDLKDHPQLKSIAKLNSFTNPNNPPFNVQYAYINDKKDLTNDLIKKYFKSVQRFKDEVVVEWNKDSTKKK